MYTNETIFSNLNSIIRKERDGGVISPDQFNDLLKQCSLEIANDEVSIYERTKVENEIIRALKENENVAVSSGVVDLTGTTADYWKPVKLYNIDEDGNFIDIQICTTNEYNRRRSSTLEQPTSDFPVAKIDEQSMTIYPNPDLYSSNYVVNGGYTGDTDWVDTNSDGEADNWTTSGSSTIVTGVFGFSGRAQTVLMNSTAPSIVGYNSYPSEIYAGYFSCTAAQALIPGNTYYISFDYYVSAGTGSGNIHIWVTGSGVDVDSGSLGTTMYTKASYSTTFTASSSVFSIYFVCDSTTNNTRRAYIDKVYISDASSNLYLDFLRVPEEPYFDYYYDANDNIQYLPAATAYTLLTNETYTDKDDGTIRTAGYTITSGENKTTELWLYEPDRAKVLYRMLQKLGVSLNEQDALQYGLIKEQNDKQ